jgi:hypothetical protein
MPLPIIVLSTYLQSPVANGGVASNGLPNKRPEGLEDIVGSKAEKAEVAVQVVDGVLRTWTVHGISTGGIIERAACFVSA